MRAPIRTPLATALLGMSIALATGNLYAQADTGGTTTRAHKKQVIGYITEWDAFKAQAAGLPAQGSLNQLNIDYSKYTMLNFSFFGVAEDGSLHSGDQRVKELWRPGRKQVPAALIDYRAQWDSFDTHLLFGEQELIERVTPGVLQRAAAQGFENVKMVSGAITWSNPGWGVNKPIYATLPLKKIGGAPGLLELAHQHNVKVMASIGGWSMCKHISDVAADPEKRARLVADAVKLINLGFDGIDLDWEYPGPFEGMNFTGKEVDYDNFLTLMRELRAGLPRGTILSAAISADPKKLQKFDWVELDATMDYFNFMTYDYNGGWSDRTGHNSPVADYAGSDYSKFNWQGLLGTLQGLKVNLDKVTFGTPFYGRGVVTDGPASLGAKTLKKKMSNVNPDGDIVSAADYTNWPKDVYDGQPNYSFIKSKLAADSGWTVSRDPQAKVPYATKGNFFLSFDDPESIGEKARFIKQHGLAGTIVWNVFGDLELGGTLTNHGKINSSSEVKSPLVNALNDVFASAINRLPTVSLVAPTDNAQVAPGTTITLDAQAADADGTVTSVAFYDGNTLLGTSTSAPYRWPVTLSTPGRREFSARATDNSNESATSLPLHVNVSSGNAAQVAITAPLNNAHFKARQPVTISSAATDSDGTVASVAFYADQRYLGSVTAAPFTFVWNTAAAGSYALTAVATDNSGLVSTSAPVNITVDPSTNLLPKVSLVTPRKDQLYRPSDTVTFSANASDPEGQLAGVAFYLDSVLIGTKTAAPFAVSVSAPSASPHVISAVATDAEGESASSAVNFIVAPAGIDEWVRNGKVYAAGTVVAYGSKFWTCVVAHSSQSDWAPGAVNLWKETPVLKGKQ